MHPDDEALSEAQFLMYDAWETSDGAQPHSASAASLETIAVLRGCLAHPG